MEVGTEGDSFSVAFSTAGDALAAAREAQEGLAGGPIHVRMGIHTATPNITADRVQGDFRDLSGHRLKDFREPVFIFQLGSHEFPPVAI